MRLPPGPGSPEWRAGGGTFRVDPDYGYGWAAEDGPMDVPPRFLLQAAEHTGGFRPGALIGRVVERNPPLATLWLLLTRRSGAAYTIRGYETLPAARAGAETFSTSGLGMCRRAWLRTLISKRF